MSRAILLIKRERFSRLAQDIAEELFGRSSVATYSGTVGDPEPPILSTASPDYLISFLSPWIVRKATLDRCGVALNFHPGSTDYPGTGCYNFALYDEAPEFGAVCHHMLPKVDTGKIVLERRFPVAAHETVETLKLATMNTMIGMFNEVAALLAAGEPLPAASTHWTRRPYTKREMDDLKVLRHTMEPSEVRRRIRATVYPGYPGPAMHMADGSIIPVVVPDRAAIA